ncbi:nuclear apoptosis-inducing factor 1 [Scophthalmus maximus]|uniref:nuclear apoptosis-inducing factor 1 n=1 Tax=Scophthalmus maximus TaxID=52904 RepID=UPI001FA92E0B|nr:nuclear apoptosis-inducing factor 1 [Scophthalmus maximus]XP_047185429.1 nuclear apoptosis-inducing factor 1 [Scophthalmus maximus]
MVSVAKKRKMNFSEREVEIIVEEIEKHKHTLVNHFNAGVTHMAKNHAWLEILRKVNAVTTCPRELAEVKKKWSDMKTEVRRKVAQARAAIEGTAADCAPVPVILTAMQQRICNLLGEATIISLPAGGDSDAEMSLPVTVDSAAATVTTVTLTEALPGGSETVCDESKPLNAETTFHALEDGGVVEYCTTTVGADSAATVVTAAVVEAPVEMLASSSASSPLPPPLQGCAKPQELKSRIALNSARLLQEQRVTNVHIRQIAQHLEGQNELLQMMRRSQEAQAFAQERQALALEGTQAALLALVQMLRPTLKDLRKFLQSGTEAANPSSSTATAAAAAVTDGSGTDEQNRPRTPPAPPPPPPPAAPQTAEETQ